MLTLTPVIVACVVSICIFLEDLKFRAVTWILFPILWSMGVLNTLIINGFQTNLVLNHMLINYLLISIQGLILYIYARLIKKNIKGLLGLGDILCIVAIAPFFSPLNFLIYYILSIALAILVHLLLLLFFGEILYPKTVPLAGFQALTLFLVILVSQLYLHLNLSSDHWMIARIQIL